MRILVTGANGLIGSAIVRHLIQDGHAVTGSVRDPGRAGRLLPGVPLIGGDFNTDHDPDIWRQRVAGFDAVVNCVGVLQDGGRDSLENAHIHGATALFKGAEAAGIRRIVHISAIGADPDGQTGFARTKAQTEQILSDIAVDWVVLRPGLVLARTVYGGTAAIRGLAGLPLLTPLPTNSRPIQVIGIDDLTRIVGLALQSPDLAGGVHDLAAAEPTTLRDIVSAYRTWLGYPPARAIDMPAWAAQPLFVLADFAGRLGWRSPLRSTAWQQLATGVTAQPDHLANPVLTGEISPLLDVLKSIPATVQDRWHARLFFIKPMAIVLLALFWIASGLIALGPARQAATSMAEAAGLTPAMASLLTYVTALLDILIGAAMLWKPTHRPALAVSVLVCLAYLAAGTLLQPGLWLDPLGPLVKIFPVIGLTALVAAMGDDR